MNREIKFRGKRLDNQEWVYGLYVYNPLTQTHYIYLKEMTPQTIGKKTIDYWDHFMIDPETLGQYTGMKDSDGIEVYEGDILEWYFPNGDTDRSDMSTKAVVIWNECGFDTDLYEYGLIDFLKTKGYQTVKVIGNIHDKEGEQGV